MKMLLNKLRTRALIVGGVLIAASMMSACGGGGGSGNKRTAQQIPVDDSNSNFVYQGPAASTDDVQRFRVELWDNIRLDSRCGQCHDEIKGQQPMFARTDDINLAYQAANSVVDLTSPGDSRMVQKFANGHHFCWQGNDSACADILERWISAWAATAGSGAKSIVLTAPSSLRDPGSSKNFPVSSAGFTGVHNLLMTYCSGCHSDTAQTKQQPYFASSDIDVAYAAVQSKINLNEPAKSRLVVRLRDEFHNCWSDCASNAAEMLTAITTFAGGITTTGVDPSLVISKAQALSEGIIAASGGRFEKNMIALYEFKPDDSKPGGGNVAYDTSGVDPSMNMTLYGNYAWVGGWGVRFSAADTVTNTAAGRAQAMVADSGKLYNLISSTGEYSIEAWIAPANVTQKNAAAISYSGAKDQRNFALAQTLYDYQFYHRESTTDDAGAPFLTTNDTDEKIAQATLQHVVITFSGAGKRKIYVNGELIKVEDKKDAGNLSSWSNSFTFVLGNEASQKMPWQGVVRMAAVFNRALTLEQIQQNYQAGVGEKFFLLFAVSQHVGKSNVYVVFEVSRFDDYGYLFNAPFIVSLDKEPLNFQLQGMRIGVNGKLATGGQAYQRLNVPINTNNADAEDHIPVSSIGTVIGAEISAAGTEDEFFLQFDRIGNDSNVIVEAEPAPPSAPVDLDPQPRVGVRTFEEISATMSNITGVPRTNANVAATYERVKQQLPTKENIEGFLSAHQMGIVQLGIEYCNALVDDTSLRASFYSGFDFNATADLALHAPARDSLINPLLSKVVGTNLATQPTDGDITDELNALINRLNNCGGSCSAARTQIIAKAVCSTVLGSATMLLQ